MDDFISYIKAHWIGYALGWILLFLIELFFKRKYPQMPRWKVTVITLGILVSLFAAFLGYLYFTSSLFDTRGYPVARVEWRTEIKQADEPETWPFKEPRYMLSCLGGEGDYSVYLVKVEDITYDPSRPPYYQPQYYGLKGSWFGWKEGETQLRDGQSSAVFKKYVDQSLSLCREAEARKDSSVKQAPVEKK